MDGMIESVALSKNAKRAEDNTAGENWFKGAPWLKECAALTSVGSDVFRANHSAADCFEKLRVAVILLITAGRASDLFPERSKSAGSV